MKKTYLLVMAALIGTITFAQEGGGEVKKIGVDINTNSGGGGSFWGSPWVWVIGGAIFILLLVALLRGGSRTAD